MNAPSLIHDKVCRMRSKQVAFGFPYRATNEERGQIYLLADKLKTVNGGERISPLATMSELYSVCSSSERALLEKIRASDARQYGISAPYLGLFEPEPDYVAISNQRYYWDGEETFFPTVYLPPRIFESYQKLKAACQAETGRPLLICAGYRSPAFQLATFIAIYKLNDCDIESTVKRVVLPGFSQHGYPEAQAVDFLTEDGRPSDKNPLDFEATPEFAWLTKRAESYSWFLSYPRGNPEGLMYEPWHWQYKPKI